MEGVIEVLLRLLEAVGIGGGLAPQDLLDHAEVPRQREDLRLVEAGHGQDGADVLDVVAEAQQLAERLAIGEALRARVALRQQQGKDALRPERAYAQSGHARRVYAA